MTSTQDGENRTPEQIAELFAIAGRETEAIVQLSGCVGHRTLQLLVFSRARLEGVEPFAFRRQCLVACTQRFFVLLNFRLHPFHLFIEAHMALEDLADVDDSDRTPGRSRTRCGSRAALGKGTAGQHARQQGGEKNGGLRNRFHVQHSLLGSVVLTS